MALILRTGLTGLYLADVVHYSPLKEYIRKQMKETANTVVRKIIVALFLFWSQREFLGSTIAFLSAMGVGLGAIFRLMTMFDRGSGARTSATETATFQ